MALHSQRQCLQAAQSQKAVERSCDSPHRILQKGQLVAQLLVRADHCNTANHVRMAAQIFRRGVNHDIESEFNRPLDPGAGKGVVGNRDDFPLARRLRDRFEINQLEERVARRLDPDHARVLLYGALEVSRIGHVDEREIEIGRTPPDAFEQTKGSAIKIVADNDVRTAVDQLKNRRHRRKTGGESPAARATFQIGDAPLVGETRRINRTRVIETFMFSWALLNVGRSGVNWRHDRSGGWIGFLTGVNRAGGKVLLSFHKDEGAYSSKDTGLGKCAAPSERKLQIPRTNLQTHTALSSCHPEAGEARRRISHPEL